MGLTLWWCAKKKPDWTRKRQGTNRRAGQDEGGDAARRKEANPKQHINKQEKRTEQKRETQTTPTNGQVTHVTPQDNHGKNAQTKPQPTHHTHADQADQQIFFRPTPS